MKFKSKSLISIILSIMMVISMILVAIPANAAVVDNEPVGAGPYYLWYITGTQMPTTTFATLESDGGTKYSYDFTNNNSNQWYTFLVNKSASDPKASSTVWTQENKPTIVCDETVKSNYFWNVESAEQDGYGIIKLNFKSACTVKFTFDEKNKTLTLSEAGSTPTSFAVNFGYGGTGTGTITAKKADTTAINSGDSVNSGTSVTFTATPGENSTFGGWYSDSSCTIAISGADQSSTTYTTPVNSTTYVYAKFTSSTTPTTSYYIGGRFKTSTTDTFTGADYEWNADSENVPFVETETTGIYKVETGLTVADLSGQTSGKQDYFFLITAKSGTTTSYYGDSSVSGKYHSFQNYSSSSTSASLDTVSGEKAERLIKFNDTTATTGLVTIFLDTNGGMKLWYTTDGSSATKGDFKIVDKTDANGKLTFSAPDKAAGTANAGDEVTVTATPSSYFECKSISVSYKDNNKVAHDINANKTADNTFKFTVPADLATTDVKSQEITVKGTFTLTSTGKLDYVKAQTNGLWIDVAPYQNDSTSTLIKWNNYYGKNHNTTTNPYTFYVPKNVNLSNAHIYNGYSAAVNLNGTSIPGDGTAVVSLVKDTSYTTSGGVSTTVKVMQGSTNAMFLTTSTALPTQYNPDVKGSSIAEEDAAAKAYKEKVNYKGGSCKTMTNTGSEASFSSAMGLSSIKGRGNSSWKASAMNFGKYAFNMKLSSATNLFDMDTTESTGSKSWCLLANNADESMLRNALTYQLAKDIGILYSPEFRFVDIYDNGEYMGSYLVTEKVDVGSSKLVKGESFDDINEKAAGTVDETTVTNEEYSYGTGTYAMSYAKVTSDGNTSSIASKTGGKYLLEFEITERYTDEASWFTSPRGQHVVVKSPEFATKEQVTYIAQKFAAMEDIAFTTGATKAQLSTVMDVESFAKMYLIQEFSSNLDAASTSYYLTFDCSKNDANGNGAVFVANPVWDYDWAYGQYENTTKKGKVGNSEYILNTKDAGKVSDGNNYWVAKYKYFDDSTGTNGTNYSIQSQLASQNSAFKTEIRKQWEGANGFYTTIQKYYGTNGQINTWYNQIKESVDMNETRWNFIDKDPISSWGSVNTGSDHFNAVKSLNTWTSDRATWLNAQFTKDSEYTPFTPATPASTVTDVNGTTKNTFEVGESFLINVTTVEDDVTYSVYLGDTPVGDNVENGKIKVVATADMIGDKTFTVKATYGDKVETSTVNVTVTASTDVRTIKIYFKTATAPAYAPSVSFDGGDATAMTKSSELGKDYSGALTFAWYSVEIPNVDTTKTHALTFTSKRTKLNATWNGKLKTDNYFTADNLMRDTVAVNLTGEGDVKRNFFYSATNMVYDSTDAKNKTLGFTFVGGERVKMGSVVNDSNGTVTAVSEPTVKSATYIQMLNASMITVSSLQSELYDVNFDGKVDVKDATYIQYALAS